MFDNTCKYSLFDSLFDGMFDGLFDSLFDGLFGDSPKYCLTESICYLLSTVAAEGGGGVSP